MLKRVDVGVVRLVRLVVALMVSACPDEVSWSSTATGMSLSMAGSAAVSLVTSLDVRVANVALVSVLVVRATLLVLNGVMTVLTLPSCV